MNLNNLQSTNYLTEKTAPCKREQHRIETDGGDWRLEEVCEEGGDGEAEEPKAVVADLGRHPVVAQALHLREGGR
jgi:hypothetical protein